MTGPGGRLLDTARGAYVRSPDWVRALLRPGLMLVPTSLKFGNTYRQWRRDIARAADDPAFARERQLLAFRRLLAKAHAGSPFYRDIIDKAFGPGFDAQAVRIEDVRRLPILTKGVLEAAGPAALAVPRVLVDRAETSGSNAETPFRFYLDKDRSAREMAFVYDAWARVGYTESTARATLRGFGFGRASEKTHEWDPVLRELRLATFPLTEADAALYLDLIERRRIRFLYGYPSSVELFCRQLERLGRRPRLPFRGIMLVSEPLYEHQRQLIAKTLGEVPISCFYGMSEKAIFGAEMPGQPGVYHSNPLYCLAELVDAQGEPVTEPGGEGRLIGTGFLSTGMPFIRYDSGDFARLVEAPSPENGQRLVVAALASRRKPDFLVMRDGGRMVTMDLTSEDPDHYRGIAEFQFYQDQPGKVRFRYVLAPDGTDGDAQRVVEALHRRCRGRLDFELEAVSRIATGRNGKRAFIDQRLDFSLY